jgi:hypothetical protein
VAAAVVAAATGLLELLLGLGASFSRKRQSA